MTHPLLFLFSRLLVKRLKLCPVFGFLFVLWPCKQGDNFFGGAVLDGPFGRVGDAYRQPGGNHGRFAQVV